MSLTILQGGALEQLRTLPDASIQCCVTSPPYFGLRRYLKPGHPLAAFEIGQEKTPDEFVANLVAVFREVRRVLKPDGTLWVNIGDSYSSQPGQRKDTDKAGAKQQTNGGSTPAPSRCVAGLKPKDLIGIPWLLAFALRADGWWLRQDIIWSKPNPMPESVTDRCTKAHEYIFLLSKSASYFYDHEAVKEPVAESQAGRVRADQFGGNKGELIHHSPGAVYRKGRTGVNAFRGQGHFRDDAGGPCNRDGRDMADVDANAGETRNRRSVWEVATSPYAEAHFATFPPDLIKPCILAGSRPGDTVLDPFGGSGTTGQVAIEYGRKAVLIELNPEYIPLIETRCAVTPGLNLA